MSMPNDIVVIEDDAIMREALGEWLGGAGYSVRAAADGAAGLAAVEVSVPALVITDMHMPGMNGSTVIAELKQRHPDLPIIAISGLFSSGYGIDAGATVALGAARALSKPFKRSELLAAIAEVLGSRAT